MNGFGLPFSIVAIITGIIAMKKAPENKPWPLIGVLVAALGAVISVILWIISLMYILG